MDDQDLLQHIQALVQEEHDLREQPQDSAAEQQDHAARLKKVMDTVDCVNIFISEGAGVESIVAEMQAKGQEVPRDAFGHVSDWYRWFRSRFLVAPPKSHRPGDALTSARGET